jgi:hypothetical protein
VANASACQHQQLQRAPWQRPGIIRCAICIRIRRSCLFLSACACAGGRRTGAARRLSCSRARQLLEHAGTGAHSARAGRLQQQHGAARAAPRRAATAATARHHTHPARSPGIVPAPGAAQAPAIQNWKQQSAAAGTSSSCARAEQATRAVGQRGAVGAQRRPRTPSSHFKTLDRADQGPSEGQGARSAAPARVLQQHNNAGTSRAPGRLGGAEPCWSAPPRARQSFVAPGHGQQASPGLRVHGNPFAMLPPSAPGAGATRAASVAVCCFLRVQLPTRAPDRRLVHGLPTQARSASCENAVRGVGTSRCSGCVFVGEATGTWGVRCTCVRGWARSRSHSDKAGRHTFVISLQRQHLGALVMPGVA